MRMTLLGSTNSNLQNLQDIQNKINTLQTNISTGQKLHSPSDDPAGASRVLGFNKQMKQNESYLKNISNSTAFLEETAFTMEEIENKTVSILTELANVKSTDQSDQYSIYADKIDSYLEEVLSLANTEYDGKYVFGGTDFSAEPFLYDEVAGTVTLGVTDNSGKLNVGISKNNIQQINVPGTEVFGTIDGSDYFNTLIKIRDDLNAGTLPVESDVKIIEDFNDNIRNSMAKAGNKLNSLESSKTMHENQNLTLTELISEESDTDMAEAIMEMQNNDYVLNLAYRVTSMSLNKSLMDYI